MKKNRFSVRRFCFSRPDCFEVYDTTTGETASFGMRKYEAEHTARKMNLELRSEASDGS